MIYLRKKGLRRINCLFLRIDTGNGVITMSMTAIFENTPAASFTLREKGKGVYQLIAPIFHEDGDMMNIFLEEAGSDTIKISDHGTSLMRLSYLFDIDTDNKRKILINTILKRGAELNSGNITLSTNRKTVFESIMAFVQLVTEICNMDIMSHEVVESLFYEYLANAIHDMHIAATYVPGYQPTKDADLVVDHAFFGNKNQRPIFLYGIKDTSKAQQTTIQLLTLKLEKIQYKSIVVFQDIDGGAIIKRAKRVLVNISGKVYADLNGFIEGGKSLIEEVIWF